MVLCVHIVPKHTLNSYLSATQAAENHHQAGIARQCEATLLKIFALQAAVGSSHTTVMHVKHAVQPLEPVDLNVQDLEITNQWKASGEAAFVESQNATPKK